MRDRARGTPCEKRRLYLLCVAMATGGGKVVTCIIVCTFARQRVRTGASRRRDGGHKENWCPQENPIRVSPSPPWRFAYVEAQWGNVGGRGKRREGTRGRSAITTIKNEGEKKRKEGKHTWRKRKKSIVSAGAARMTINLHRIAMHVYR